LTSSVALAILDSTFLSAEPNFTSGVFFAGCGSLFNDLAVAVG
jgi:hypothetical protein